MNATTPRRGRDPARFKEVPLCLHCLQPVDPLSHVCPHCSSAVGQLTPYLPLESIRWEADIWGRMWHQLWTPEISLPGKIFRAFLILLFAPVLLVGLFPWAWRRLRKNQR